MSDIDKLIYDLIFSDTDEYSIDISNYIKDIYQYEIFVQDIKNILKRSKVKVINSNIKPDSRTVIWELKVKK